MRLWEVRTKVELNIGVTGIFSRLFKTVNRVWFTYNTKVIYAKSLDEAKAKYYDYFFSPMKDGYDKQCLKYMGFISETESSCMTFELPLFHDVLNTFENIEVLESEVIDCIDVLKRKMIAADFRDWFMNYNRNPII